MVAVGVDGMASAVNGLFESVATLRQRYEAGRDWPTPAAVKDDAVSPGPCRSSSTLDSCAARSGALSAASCSQLCTVLK